MNYSLMFYPWCKRRGGEGVEKEETKKVQNVSHTSHMNGFSSKRFFFLFVFSTNLHQPRFVNISWVRTPRGRQISCNLPDLPSMSGTVVFLYPSVSVIESANSEKLLSIWIQSSTCETHSMADFFFFFLCQCCWITQALVPHTLSPDVQGNVTVKLQRKMVTGCNNFTVYILWCFLFCKVFNCGGQLLLPHLFGWRCLYVYVCVLVSLASGWWRVFV